MLCFTFCFRFHSDAVIARQISIVMYMLVRVICVILFSICCLCAENINILLPESKVYTEFIIVLFGYPLFC